MAFTGKIISGLRETLEGELPLVGFAGSPLTLAFFMVAGTSPMAAGGGVSNAARLVFQMMDEEPELFHELLQRLTQMTINYLNYQISVGAQVVQLFESIADQIDLPRYETFVQPYHEQIFAALDPSIPSILFAKECPHLSLMLESGADVLSVGKCVNLSIPLRKKQRAKSPFKEMWTTQSCEMEPVMILPPPSTQLSTSGWKGRAYP